VDANCLLYGDNLKILREHFSDDCVDLIYLDPPFNSDKNYNVIFKSVAQGFVFEDTKRWGIQAEETYAYLTNSALHCGQVSDTVSRLVAALRTAIGERQVLAYLVEMTVRLVELHRVLRPTGSLILHCDPTASHYLKLVLDAIFGPRRYLNEISWRRSSAHSDIKQGMRRCGRVRDVLLVYSKTDTYTWNPVYTPYDPLYLASEYRHTDALGQRYKETDLTAAKPGGDTSYDWRVKRPETPGARWEADLDGEFRSPMPGWQYKAVRPYVGRYWAWSKQNLLDFARRGKLIHRETGMPRLMQFAHEMPGVPIQDDWDDIQPVSGNEDLGYPTQKPLALLERVIQMSSNPGDLLLDPFCGCGTAIVAAEKLGRRWAGIDLSNGAITVMLKRLKESFGLEDVRVKGSPTEVEGAHRLARSTDGRYEFQWWALGLVGAWPMGGARKKGADRGIDGVITFTSDRQGALGTILVGVKSGRVDSGMVRDFRGTVERDRAAMGLFITLEEPSAQMKIEAASAGLYHSELSGRDYQRIQILTIRELLEEKKHPHVPPYVFHGTGKAERIPDFEQSGLFGRLDPRDQAAPAEQSKPRKRRAAAG
jgi:DNA modification methylase